jgi:hypothetical protein
MSLPLLLGDEGFDLFGLEYVDASLFKLVEIVGALLYRVGTVAVALKLFSEFVFGVDSNCGSRGLFLVSGFHFDQILRILWLECAYLASKT